MGFPDTACVAFRLSQAEYRPLFEQVWGKGSFDIKFPPETERICDTPGGAAVFGGSTTPIPLSPEDRTRANMVYDHWGQSIDSYEQSLQVSAFSSKFDAFLKGDYKLTADEMAGLKLFDGKGNCNSCHLDGRGTTLKSGQTDTGAAAAVTPLFTCFGSANEGLPLNPRDAIYYQTTPDSFGFTGNPLGFGYRDLGLGTFLRSGPGCCSQPELDVDTICPNCRRPNAGVVGAQCGYDTTAVPHYRGARALLPEGVLSQRLHQEPEATRPLLQHARQV